MRQGSLAVADDVVINRDNVIEPRRGFAIYGNAMGGSPTTDVAHQLFTYKNRLLRHFGANSGTTLQYDSDDNGTFVSFSAAVAEVQKGIRIKYAESNGNLYFTTNSGICKLSVATASDFPNVNVQPAGMYEGLDITLGLNSQQGFLNQESVVGYRVLWGVKDLNQNLILGSPSNRQIISNPLTPLLLTNFNALLALLDTCNLPNGIHYGSYVSSFGLAVGSPATSLRNNLIAVANQIDTDVEAFSMVPNVTGITGNTDRTNVITGITPTGVVVGQQVTGTNVINVSNINGTTTASSPIITSTSLTAGQAIPGQLVSTVSSGILVEGTTVVSVDGSFNVTLSTIPLIAGTFTNEFIFTNPNPIPDQTYVTAVGVSSVTISNNTTFGTGMSAVTYTNGLTFSSIFAQQNTNASTYAVTVVTTADPSPILKVNNPVSVTGIVPSSFNTITGIVQATNASTGGHNVQITYEANPGVYTSGTATVKRYKYGAITQPLVFSTDPTTNELISMQVYYDAIVDGLQVEPTTIVATPAIFNNSNSTQSATVNISFPIPQGITTANFYQVYRTEQVAGSTGIPLDALDPGDEEFLAYEGNPSGADLSNGYIQIQDITPDSFLGASLYTNANSGTGITSANTPPPLAADLTLYKNYMFYANTVSQHSINISLLSVVSMVSGTSTITITNGTTSNTYTFTTGAENPATKHIHISTLPTPAQQIAETAQSIVNVINRQTNELVYAFYESGTTGVPGKILLQARTLGAPAFYLTANSTGTGNEFNPAIPVNGQANISDNDVRPNRVYYSTQFEPDSVPLLNYFDLGPRDKKILRILALRESLFVFKEEGIYRVTGATAPFSQDLFDSSSIINAPDSCAILNNTIYGLSNQGVISVNDVGVSIISRDIEGSLIKFSAAQYPGFYTSTFGLGYESDRTYNLWTVTSISDTQATQGFRYNTITQAWTRCTKTATCGVINFEDNKMYIGATDTNFIEKERKNFDRTDYADRQFNFTLGAGSIIGNQIKLGSLTDVSVGDAIVQVQYLTIKQFNRLLGKLDNDSGLATKTYSNLTQTVGSDLRGAVTSLAVMLDNDANTGHKNYASSISGYTSSFPDTQSAFNVIIGLLNSDTGTRFKNYMTSTGTVTYEINIITENSSTNTITTEYAYPFIQGVITIYNHINSTVQWSPETCGDPSISKHISEATMIFEKMSFTDSTISFASDLFPAFISQDFPGLGNGSYGNSVYGQTTYGDSGNAIPLRTYIPRNVQRCRFLNIKYNHAIAREEFSIFGLSLTYNTTSQRAWR